MSLIPLSMSGIAAPLRSESVNKFGSSQADSGGWGVVVVCVVISCAVLSLIVKELLKMRLV